MDNFTMAKLWGIKMAELTKEGGTVILGLVGSGLSSREIKSLFKEINKATPVEFLSAEVGVCLEMKRL